MLLLSLLLLSFTFRCWTRFAVCVHACVSACAFACVRVCVCQYVRLLPFLLDRKHMLLLHSVLG